ncbi:hypothetical protein JCM13580A_32920 [Streptomyces drozdowiczii]
MGGAERGDQRVLYGISRFLAVAQCPEGHGPQPVAMASCQLTEGIGITGHMVGEKVRVARRVGIGTVVLAVSPLSCRHPCIQTDPRQKVNGEVGWIIGMTKSAFRLRFECAPSALY